MSLKELPTEAKTKLPKPSINIKKAHDVTQETIQVVPVNQFPEIDLREKARQEKSQTNLNSQITSYLIQVVAHKKAKSTLETDSKKKTAMNFGIRSIQKAVDLLSNHPEQIKSGAQAQELHGIGKGIGQRINEILTTGRLAEVDTIEDRYIRLVQELTKISGIGLVKARKLIQDYQIESLDDLIAKYQSGQIQLGKNQLTQHQVVGLRYAYELEQKIPRAEIDQFKPLLEAVVHEIDPKLIFQICGSYRRGKKISGDIDILISHPDFRTKKLIEKQNFLPRIVEALTEHHILVDHLTEAGQTKYMGVGRLPLDAGNIDSIARRIDIRVLPYDSYATALLYFTGSGNFNQLFRAVALQRGYTVSEYAVCPLEDGLKGDPIPVESEADIFKLIGVKFLTPEEREF